MYMLLCRQQNAGQNYNIKKASKSFKNVTYLKYFPNILLSDMDWISLVKDKNQWRALVNAVINLWGSIISL
jgi:hypothetical protein